jgi:hypothetical protein
LVLLLLLVLVLLLLLPTLFWNKPTTVRCSWPAYVPCQALASDAAAGAERDGSCFSSVSIGHQHGVLLLIACTHNVEITRVPHLFGEPMAAHWVQSSN